MNTKPLTILEVTSIIAYVLLTALGSFATYTIDEFIPRILIMPFVSTLIIMDLSHRYHYKKINENANHMSNMLVLAFILSIYI